MMRSKRLLSAVSAFAIFMTSFTAAPSIAGAAEDGNTVELTPAYDMQLRLGRTGQDPKTMQTSVTITDGAVTDDFVGAMRFEIPETDEGKELSGVSLKLVTERKKGSGDIYLYPFAPENWEQEEINYDDVAAEITAARESEPIASFTPEGQNTKAIHDNGVTENTLAQWTNNIEIPVSAVTPGQNFDFILSGDMGKGETTSDIRFYTKDNEGAACNVEFTDVETTVDGSGKYVIPADRLVPMLTLTYTDVAEDQKLDLSSAAVYAYAITDKNTQYSINNGGDVTLTDAVKSESQNGGSLIDGSADTVFTAGQSTNFMTVIDLGVTAQVSRIVARNVHQAAVIGVAGESDADANGVLTDDSVTLKQNWARMNNGTPHNLTDAVTASYGTRTGDVYDTVTLSGDFGGVRYIA